MKGFTCAPSRSLNDLFSALWQHALARQPAHLPDLDCAEKAPRTWTSDCLSMTVSRPGGPLSRVESEHFGHEGHKSVTRKGLQCQHELQNRSMGSGKQLLDKVMCRVALVRGIGNPSRIDPTTGLEGLDKLEEGGRCGVVDASSLHFQGRFSVSLGVSFHSIQTIHAQDFHLRLITRLLAL